MEAGALFNSGFLGNNFIWWVGQIADDSEWRDNTLSGKFEDANTIPGWGRRYKVRIMGIHDKEEESIKSENLPWANVMYPITAGGGQTNASQTPSLRQGNFVFGFFMDGQDQQVPVIMGILGNNAQTPMATKTGQSDTNFSATSGYAEGKTPPSGSAKPTAPDEGLVTTKPKTPEQASNCAPPAPGVQLNQYGLDPTKTLSRGQLQAATDARNTARDAGLPKEEVEAAAQRAVADFKKKECQQANSPSSPSTGNPTKENPDAMHQLSAADVKRETKLKECIVVMKPDDPVSSAISAIQTVLSTLTEKLNSYLSAISSYIDAVSSTIEDIQSLIANAACEIAKYMKILFDKIMEYVLKVLNKAMTKAIAALPSDMRSMFGDLKQTITELILCLYNKLTANLCALIQGILDDVLDMGNAEAKARENVDNPQNDDVNRKPTVPTCYAEELVGQVLASNQQQIDSANNNLLDNMNAFLEDIQSELAGVSGALSDISSLIGDITGSITSALSFANIKLNIFGCELSPNIAVSDKYCMTDGGSGQPDSSLPSNKSIENTVANTPESDITQAEETPFAQPPAGTADVELDKPPASTTTSTPSRPRSVQTYPVEQPGYSSAAGGEVSEVKTRVINGREVRYQDVTSAGSNTRRRYIDDPTQ